MAQRLIQNFWQSRALLWAGADFKAEALERTLAKLGVSMVRVDHVDGATLDHNRDIVFLDADQVINPASLLMVGSSLPAAPVVGIVGVEAPSRLRLLAEAGGTAILRKPIQASAVYSALFLCVNNYRRMRAMERRIAEHARKRHGRRFVVKAIVALVQAHGIGDEEAYARLRRESMRRRSGIEEFCESLFQAGGDLAGDWAKGSAASRQSSQEREEGNALSEDTEDGGADVDGPAGGAGGRPHQARRA